MPIDFASDEYLAYLESFGMMKERDRVIQWRIKQAAKTNPNFASTEAGKALGGKAFVDAAKADEHSGLTDSSEEDDEPSPKRSCGPGFKSTGGKYKKCKPIKTPKAAATKAATAAKASKTSTAVPITPALIKRLNLKPGDKFWGIAGSQTMQESYVTFGGFYSNSVDHDKEEPCWGNITKKYRATFQEYDDIVIDGFSAYYSPDGYGTGSGCDLVYYIRMKK